MTGAHFLTGYGIQDSFSEIPQFFFGTSWHFSMSWHSTRGSCLHFSTVCKKTFCHYLGTLYFWETAVAFFRTQLKTGPESDNINLPMLAQTHVLTQSSLHRLVSALKKLFFCTMEYISAFYCFLIVTS